MLRLRPWSDVAPRYERINRTELPDDVLTLAEPCWGELMPTQPVTSVMWVCNDDDKMLSPRRATTLPLRERRGIAVNARGYRNTCCAP